jgi:hypothetical protein
MRDAFQEALLCTNDPECMNSLPAGDNPMVQRAIPAA